MFVVRVKRGVVEAVVSTACFIWLLGAVVAIDDRVRQRLAILFAGGLRGALDRVAEIGQAISDAAWGQGLVEAPLVVFAVVAAVLVLFMLKT